MNTGMPKIKLPGETVTIGPGTVPSSAGSVPVTSIEELTKSIRKISKLGIFDKGDEANNQPGTK